MTAKKQDEININPEGFTAIRRGLLEHIERGKLCPTDLGVYLYLQMKCDWATGIYQGTAVGIAFGFSDAGLKPLIQKSLRRLRDAGFINYREGDGRRKGYPILIHKFRPTIGKLLGQELNAWSEKDNVVPKYIPITEERLTGNGGAAEERLTGNGQGADGRPIQDVQEDKDFSRSDQDRQTSSLRQAEPHASLDTFGETRETLDPVRTIENFVEDLKTFIHPQAYQGDALFDSLDTLYKDADDGQEFLHSLVWFNDLRASGTMAPHFQTLKATAQYNQKAVITKVFPEILAKYRAATDVELPKSKAWEVED
jgi:hypothetical protein